MGNIDSEESVNMPTLLSVFNDLQEERRLLIEENKEKIVLLKFYQKMYLKVAKKRRKLQKSVNAIQEFTNKYMGEVKSGEDTECKRTAKEIKSLIKAEKQIDSIIDVVHTKGKVLLDNIEKEHGPA